MKLANSVVHVTDSSYLVYEGNVEICINGTYIAICDQGWDDVEAQLVCNAVGYGEPAYRKSVQSSVACV